jgi:hypothetical protein
MRNDRNEQVAEMLLARQWGRASDFFGDEPTDTFVQWPPEPPRPAMRTARGTVPPEREFGDEYELEYDRD